MNRLDQLLPPNLINFDRESLERDIVNRIKLHPKWKDNYNGLLHHDSLTMIISIFTYLFGKNAESVDKKLRDVFLQTSYSDEAKTYNLNRMNIQLKQNREAALKLRCTLVDSYKTEPFFIPNNTIVYGLGLDSSSIPFEIISKNDDGYDYLQSVKIEPNLNFTSFNIEAYSGQTKKHTYNIKPNQENFEIQVPYYNVIEDSIKVYYYVYGSYYLMQENRDDNYGQIIANNLFPTGMPKYILKYGFNGQPRIIFGNDAFSGRFNIDHNDGYIVIFGRYGGGNNSNVYEGSINETKLIELNSSERIKINFTNITNGVGGADSEILDDIIDYVFTRFGRGKQIVDTIDSKNAIQSNIIKHMIEVPEYSQEKQNEIPLWHNYHYIVPKRNLENFIFPETNEIQTVEEYLKTFLNELNSFLNVQGNHDTEIENELLNYFYISNDNNYNFDATLNYSPVLSNSLTLKAFNANDRQIDRVKFEGSYPTLKTVYNTEEIGKAFLDSKELNKIFIYVSSDAEKKANNNLSFKIDHYDYIFNIGLPVGEYSAEEIVDTINNSVKTNVANNPDVPEELYQLVFVNDNKIFKLNSNKIRIESLNINQKSRIELIGADNSPSKIFYDDIGMDIGVYFPDRTTLVFNDGNHFSYDNSKLYVDINKEIQQVREEIEVEVEQDPYNITGPFISLKLFDDILLQDYSIQNGSDIKISFLNSEDEIVDEVEIKDFSKDSDVLMSYNNGSHPITGGCLLEESSAEFYTETSTLTLQLKEGIEMEKYISPFVEDYGELSFINLNKVNYVPDEETLELVEEYELLERFDKTDLWVQRANVEEGNIIELYPQESNKLVGGEIYVLEVYNATEDLETTLTGKIKFVVPASFSVVSGDLNELATTIEIFDDEYDNIYNKNYNYFKLKLIDAIIDVEAEPVYHRGYDLFDRVVLSFEKENYSYITVDYKADPYEVEGEAKLFSQILNNKSRKLLSLENVFKDINNIPMKLIVDVYVKKSFSSAVAKKEVYNLLMDNYGYNNYNYYHDINESITQEKVRNLILSNLNNYGIVNVNLHTIDNDFDDMMQYPDRKFYNFLLGDYLLSQLKQIENQYSNLAGLSDYFSLKINTIVVDA